MDKKLFSIAVGLFVLAWILLSIPSVFASDVYSVEGHVYDVTNNKPLSGVLVQLKEAKPTIFGTLTVTISENYEVTVSIDGEQAQVLQVVVGQKTILVRVVWNGVNFVLRLKKVVSVTLTFIVAVDGDCYITQTNEDGYWKIENVEEGKYYLLVSRDEYCSYLDYLEVKSDLSLTTYLLQLVEKTELELRVERLENLIPIIFERLDNLDREVTEILTEIAILKENVQNLDSRLKTAEENIEVLSQELEGVKSRLSEDEARISRLEQEVQEIYSLIIGIQENIEVIRDRLNVLENRTGYLEGRVCVLENWRLYVDESLANLFGRTEVLENRVDELQRRVEDLEIRMDAVENRVSRLEHDLYQLILRVFEIEQRITIPKEIPRVKVEGVFLRKVCDNVFEPVSGEIVWILSYNLVPMATYTDSNGYYCFENVVMDEVVLRVREMRYQTVLKRDAFVKVLWDNRENRTYVVTSISGKIYLDSLALENKVEVCLKGMGKCYAENFTGGFYEFRDVEVGTYTLTGTYNGYHSVDWVELTHEPLVLDIHLSKGVSWKFPVIVGAGLMATLAVAIIGAGIALKSGKLR